MIKLPNLDDQNYSDIVETAKRRIPVIFPEWTDFNEHDPGITIIELFAWLKEMQQYYLNRISDTSYENMLKLLGIGVLDPQPSTVQVRFLNGGVPDRLLSGAEVFAADGTVFTAGCFEAAPFTLDSFYVENENGFFNVTDVVNESETTFHPFGTQLGVDSRNFYAGISEISDDSFYDGASVYFEISDRFPVARNAFEKGGNPPRDVLWEYSTGDGFKPCEIVSDETYGLSVSGKLTLKTGRDFSESDCGGQLGSRLWLRASLTYWGCEEMPVIGMLYNNWLTLEQKQRESDFRDFNLDEGAEVLTVDDVLLKNGFFFVLLRDGNGWFYAENAGRTGTEIYVSDYTSRIIHDGTENVRVVFCNQDFGQKRMFLSSDGLPCQAFDFDCTDQILTETLKIMVSDRSGGENQYWREYAYVKDLSLAGPYDCCFSYDSEKRQLLFGDNENGEVPAPGDENIMVISCSITKGSLGNLRAGNITEIADDARKWCAIQSSAAIGGRDSETIKRAGERLKTRMKECVKAVTADDYRIIAKKTPGVRLADVCAIPLFDAELMTASDDKLANTITLAVQPYSADRFPIPDSRFLNAVKNYVENYRLITTQVKVVAPVYVKVNINADVICGAAQVEQVRSEVAKALEAMFSVYDANGTKFGAPISESDVITEICKVDGILTVKNLQLSVKDNRCYRDKYGRIIIPPHAVSYCGEVWIQVTEP